MALGNAAGGATFIRISFRVFQNNDDCNHTTIIVIVAEIKNRLYGNTSNIFEDSFTGKYALQTVFFIYETFMFHLSIFYRELRVLADTDTLKKFLKELFNIVVTDRLRLQLKRALFGAEHN